MIGMPKFAHVFSCRAPTFRNKKRDGFTKFINGGWRVVQRALAVESFYSFSEERHDTVVVSGERPETV